MPSSSEEAITTYFNVLGLTRPARAGFELMNHRGIAHWRSLFYGGWFRMRLFFLKIRSHKIEFVSANLNPFPRNKIRSHEVEFVFYSPLLAVVALLE
jgi:hypothetical protein